MWKLSKRCITIFGGSKSIIKEIVLERILLLTKMNSKFHAFIVIFNFCSNICSSIFQDLSQMKKKPIQVCSLNRKNGNNTPRFPKLFMTLKNNPTIQHLSRNFWNIKVWENSYQFRPFLLHFFGVKKNLDGPVLSMEFFVTAFAWR